MGRFFSVHTSDTIDFTACLANVNSDNKDQRRQCVDCTRRKVSNNLARTLYICETCRVALHAHGECNHSFHTLDYAIPGHCQTVNI